MNDHEDQGGHGGHAFHFDPRELRSPERIARIELNRVIDLSLEGIAPRTVLDAGAGTGLASEAFAARGLAFTALDASDRMLAIAREYLPAGVFVRSILERLPFRDAAFDLVYMGHVLHESSDIDLALREARRVARLRTVILEWPCEAPGSQASGPPMKLRISPERMVSAARGAGFRRTQMTTLTHMVLYRLELQEA